MTSAATAWFQQSLSLLRRSYFRRPVNAIGAYEPSLAAILFWALLLFLLTNPFTFMLTGANPTEVVVRNLATMHREGTSQVKLYLLRFGVPMIGFGLVMLLGKWRTAIRITSHLAPVAPFLLWTALSVFWSDAPAATARGFATLLPLFVVPVCMIAVLGPRYSARALIYSAGVMGVASVVYSLAMPAYGVHQHADVSQSVHAGLWRGVYLHKNHLGQTAGVYAAMILFANRVVLPSRIVRWGLLALMGLLIIKSGSASAVAIPILAYGIVVVLVVLNPMQRMFALMFSAMGAIVGIITVNLVLQALGRDMTFSGRDVIWSLALDGMSGHVPIGYGFMSPTYGNFLYQLSRRTGVLDPHNALLDLVLGVGVVGAVLLIAAMIASFMNARLSYVHGGNSRAGALVFAGQTAAWIVAGISESNVRPLGVVPTLGYMGLALLFVSRPRLLRGKRPPHVRPQIRPLMLEHRT